MFVGRLDYIIFYRIKELENVNGPVKMFVVMIKCHKLRVYRKLGALDIY